MNETELNTEWELRHARIMRTDLSRDEIAAGKTATPVDSIHGGEWLVYAGRGRGCRINPHQVLTDTGPVIVVWSPRGPLSAEAVARFLETAPAHA